MDAFGRFTPTPFGGSEDEQDTGSTLVQASADGLEGTASVWVASVRSDATFTTQSFPVGTAITTQFPGLTFSVPTGQSDVTDGLNLDLGPYSAERNLTVTFANPVYGLTFTLGSDAPGGEQLGSVSVYSGGSLA